MKTSVNVRFLIGVLVCAVLLGVATHGLHAIQVGRQSSFLLEQARRARDEKDFQLAVARYQQYQKLAPLDIDATTEFGLLLADLHANKSAMAALETVLRAQPERDDVRRRIVQIEIEVQRFGDAKVHLQQYLLKKSPDDASLWDLLGTCQAKSGEYADAADSFRTAIKKAPQQLDAYRHLAEVLRQNLKSAEEADKSMEDLVRANPDSAPANALEAKYLAMRGQSKAASERAETALKLDPKNVEALLLEARLASAERNYDKARDAAKRAVAADPSRAAGYTTLADVERRGGNLKNAIACLEAGVDAAVPKNENVDVLVTLGHLQIEAGDLGKAQDTLDRLKKLAPRALQSGQTDYEPLIGMLQAKIEFGRGQWQQAAEQFEAVAPRLLRFPDLLKELRWSMAVCYEKLGNPDLALAAYREAARIDPLWPAPRLGIAATLLSLGKLDEALEEYRQLAKLDQTSAVGGAGVVRSLMLKIQETAPAKPDWSEVNAILDRLAKSNSDLIPVTLLRVDALACQNRNSEAEQVLADAARKSPDRPELWSARVALAGRQSQWDRGSQLLETAKKKFGDQVWLRLAEAKLQFDHYTKESAPKFAALGDRTDSFLPADRFRLYRGLASLSTQSGDAEQARRFCRLACDADPHDLKILELRFDLAARAGDAVDARRVLKLVRDVEGEGALYHYFEAALMLLAEPTKVEIDESAFRHLAKAAELRPGWARVPLLTALMRDKQGHAEAALEDYLKAIELGERNPGAVRRAVELLYSQHRYAEADKVLRQLEQRPNVWSSDLERLDLEIAVHLDNLERGVEMARKLAAGSTAWRDHLWLGQLLAELGRRARTSQKAQESETRFAEAETSLRKAVEMAPQVPETWVALIQFLAATDRKKDATAMISEAAGKLPPDVVSLALGSCYEALRDRAAASKHYQAALARAPNDIESVRLAVEFFLRTGQSTEAEPYLRKIVSGQLASKPADVIWARRGLAFVLIRSGRYQNILQALTLLDQNLAAAPSADDQREKAIALSSCPEPARKQEAIRILEGLVAAESDSAEIRMALAQLYLNEKDWIHAAQHLRSLLSSHGQEPRYVAFYVARLLERQETQEAELWLRRLEQIAPNDFSTASLKAEALVEHHQVDPAIETLHDFLSRSPAAEPADRAERIRLVASFLELLAARPADTEPATTAKLLTEAERLWRDYVKQQPDKELLLATFVARRGRVDEALSVAERAWPAADVKTIATATNDLIGAALADPAHAARLEKVILAASEKHGRPAVLLLELGNLQMRQERLGEAEASYREALRKDDTSVVAMNNLANLLTLRKTDLDEALRLIERTIEIAGPVPTLLDSRATVLMALGRPEQALADLEIVVKQEPRPNRQFHRALAFWQLGQRKVAAEALEDAHKGGLKPEQLSPPERAAYRELAAKLEP